MRGAPDRVEQDGAVFVRGRDVEKGDLVGPLRLVAQRQLSRIARVAQAGKRDPLDTRPWSTSRQGMIRFFKVMPASDKSRDVLKDQTPRHQEEKS